MVITGLSMSGRTTHGRPMRPNWCPVYLRLPWKGPWSSAIARTIGQTAQAAYNAVNVKCVYTTSRAFNLRKDVLPSHSLSNLIYQFECRHRASRYVGRTAQRLSSRLGQHVPLNILVTDEARALRARKATCQSDKWGITYICRHCVYSGWCRRIERQCYANRLR